ncbi:restless-like transposase [Diaporthe amygdali]|uniref:restless-like transposase n=1 Tax=Phomopsis amygdali TaxID=1214568 RepID=UPI0022FF3790|nr:restless-like transposase [Diaporthe amygdali]KAJ0103796.1 restless-like transposase [Diaporthe amygdali]
MAPIICEVHDSNGNGVQEMEVCLQCFVIPGTPDVEYVSYTNEDGGIDRWFRKDEDGAPKPVEALDYTHFRITFRTKSIFETGALPWLDVCTDLYLIGKVQHNIALQFGPDNLAYQLKHTSRPLFSWVRDCEVDWAGRRIQPHSEDNIVENHVSGSSSGNTKQLSPDYPDLDSCSEGDLDDDEDSDYIESQSLLEEDRSFSKRKASFDEGDMPPGKRVRFN